MVWSSFFSKKKKKIVVFLFFFYSLSFIFLSVFCGYFSIFFFLFCFSCFVLFFIYSLYLVLILDFNCYNSSLFIFSINLCYLFTFSLAVFFLSVNLLVFLMLCSVLSSDFLNNGHLVSILSPLWLQLMCHIITSFFVSLSHSCKYMFLSFLSSATGLCVIYHFLLSSSFYGPSYFFFQLLFSFGFIHALHIFYFHSYFLCYLLYFLDHGVLVVAFCLFC